MSQLLHILLLEDNPDDVALEQRELRKLGLEFTLHHVESEDEYSAYLQATAPDIILADFSLPHYDGMSALACAQAMRPDVPFVFVSGTIGEEVAIDALQRGATDYVLKQRLDRLVPAVERALREVEEHRAHREVAEALAKTQQRLEAIINYSPAMIYMQDVTGKLLLTNRLYNEHFGQGRDTLEGKRIEDFMSPSEVKIRHRQDARVITQGLPIVQEQTLEVGGTSREFLTIKFPIYDQNKHLDGIGGIDADITDRKLADVTLRNQASLLDQASDAIYVTNIDRRFTYGNLASEKISGWPASEIIGRTISEVFADVTEEKLDGIRAETEKHGSWQGEEMIRNRAGDPVWVDLRVSSVKANNGEGDGHILICTDITEKRKLTEQFLRVQRMENIGMLAAGIAHDFNNVLAPIGMVATLLRGQLEGDRNLRFLEMLEKSAERGAGLVRQIMGFVNGVDGGYRELQVKHLLRDVVVMIKQTFPKNITLREDIPPDLWVIKGNASQIHQILLNLCVNARDAMPELGELTLTGENVVLDRVAAAAIPQAQAGNWLMLKVADTGTGIPTEVQAKIWEPFFSTKSADKGTGLGLSTVRVIVEQHRGFIHLESAPNSGSCFRIYFPAETEGAEFVETPAASFNASGHGERILVVDDEPMVLEATTQALREAGYEVIPTSDGLEAARLFLERPDEIDLVLTDLDMPMFNGAELITAVHATNPAVVIIAMSGSATSEIALEPQVGRALSAILSKPFDTRQLLSLVKERLSQGSVPPFPFTES